MQIFTTEYSTKSLCSLADVLCTLKNLISLVKTGKQEGVLRESHTYVLGKRTLSLIVLCMSLGFTGSVLAQDVDLVSSPTSVEADQGDTFTVPIEIPQANSQPFNAASLFLNFDPAILQVTSVVAASGNQFTLPIGPSFDNLTGTINYTGTVIQTSFTAGFPILDVTFNVIGVSSTSIDFNINVGGSRNTNIALTGASVFGTAVSIPIIIASANEDPLADFTINPNPAETNEVVTFDGSISTDDGSIASYAWDFGDGTTQTANGNDSTTHSYTALNTYTVALTVTDNLGATNTTTKTIIVSSPTVNQFTVNASSNGNGTIDPSGAVSVNGGSDQTFNFTPDSGFEVSEVLVNSTAIIPVPTTSYTLTNVTVAAGISVSFSEIVTGPFQLCIASGSGDLTAFGRNFVGDPATAPPTGLGFTRTNGKTFTNYNGAIAGTSTADELTLFQKEIYGGAGGDNPSYIYDIPVANGFYQVDLYFAEVFHPAAGGRIFDVILDGNRILDEYDLVDPVKDGLNANQTAITRTYFVQVADGVMSLQIGAASTDNGKLSGICVTEVGNANLHPVSSIGDLTYDALVAVADPLNIQDPDNDLLSIVFNGMPASLTYNPSTNQLEGTPLATDGGTFTINAIISDGNNSPVTEEFTLVINPPAGNDPPVITAIADLAINEGEAISQAINVTDDNLPSANIEIFDVSEGGTNNPFTPTTAVAVGTLVDNTGGSYTFNWIPATGTGRSYLARVSADDGVNPLVIEEFRIDVAQQLPGTILARTFNNPVPWYGSSTPGGGLTIAIEPTAAKNIGYIDNGDFVEYLINVPIAGVYDFEVFAGKGNGGTTLVTFSEESGGGFAAIGSVNVIQTGWQDYVSYTTQLSFANPGVQTLRFNFNGGANIRDFNFTPSTSNNAPIVTISSPADGIALTTGTTLNFTGSVTDVEDDDATLTAALNWSSDLQGNLSTGSNFSFALTTIGTHTITAEVTDSDAITPLSGSATISLIVTETDPSCDARFRVNAGGPVLIADSGDFEEDQVTVFPSGTALTGTPSPYINIITPAVDKTFGSTAPLVSNTTGYPDFLFQTERFSDALNPDNMKWIFPTGDGVYDVKILFNENWTGEIGNPRVFDVEIEGVIALNDYRPSGPAGADVNVAKVETYRATVADGVLNINFIQGTQNPSVKGFDICFVSDLPTDTPPVVAISSPTDNTTPVSIDRLVSTTFTAAVEDAEDDNTTLTNALVWSIDPIEANFAGTGGTFDDTLLVPGVYTIRASSTDSDTNTAFDEIEVTVLGPDVNFISPAGNADLATTNVQVTWSATKMNFGGTTPEHFHLWVNPADENNLVALDRISTASFPGQLFWDLTAIDGIVEGSNKVIIIAADSGHLEFLNIEARDEVNFNVLGDTTDPTITCLVNIVVDNNPGLCGAVVTFTTPIGEDDRPGAITTQTAGLASGDTFPIGITTQSYLVTDATGLTATCSFDVTVNDAEDPILTCPADESVDVDTNGDFILADYTDLAAVSDNCDNTFIVTQSPVAGSTLSADTQVTLSVTDAAGNTGTCAFNVNITPDNTAPTITCLTDITVNNDSDQCGAVVTFTAPVGTDERPGATTNQLAGLASGDFFPLGITTQTYEVADVAGNIAQCSFTITVNDGQAPDITCPADIVRISLNGNPIVIEDIGIATGNDNCPGAVTITGVTLIGDLPIPDTFPVGTTQIKWTAVDEVGNVAQCIQNITINFTPSTVKAITAFSLPGQVGSEVIVGTSVNLTVAAGTDISVPIVPANIEISPNAIISPAAGIAQIFNVPVQYTVTAQDNSAHVWTVNVTVAPDVIPPTVTCPADITVANDAGVCGAVVTFNATATDNLPWVSLSYSIASGSVFNVGTTTVMVTATDANDNTATCSFDVTVNDTEAPVINNCPADIIVNTDSGLTTAVVSYTPPTASDNCPWTTVTLTSGLGSGSAFPVGSSTEVYTITDAAGLTAICSFKVTVGDDAPPTVTCPADITVANDAGVCGALVTLNATATDNLPGVSLSYSVSGESVASESVFDVGTTTVIATATDASGLTATCSFDVTVNDTEAPTLSCPFDQTVQGDLAGNAILPDFIGLAVASDNCDPNVVVIQSPAPGTTVSGTVLVTLTATDAELNSAPCTFNAIIEPAILASLTIVPSTITANLIQGETAMVNYVVDSDDASTLPTPAAMSIIDNATDNPATWASTTSAANQGTSYEVNLDATGLTPATYTAILTAGPVSGYTNAGIPITLIVEAVPTVLSVTSFTLVNADNEQDIMTITNGMTIDVTTLPTLNLNIRANTTSDVESVQMQLTGTLSKTATENFAPYALYGDSSGNYVAQIFVIGTYSLTANPYSGKSLGGTSGNTLTVNFELTDQEPVCASFSAGLSGITNPSSCLGVGSATAVPSGGVSPFTYQWDNGETTATAINLAAGPHSVIVVDDSGCSKTLTFTLTGPPIPVVTLAPFANLLNTAPAFTLTGGSPGGGTYSGPGVTGISFDPAIGVGTYAITYSYTDSNGCANSATRSITVTTETSNAALLVLDATDDSVLFALTDGLQINKAVIGNTPLGIIFNTSLNPGGVIFNLSGPITENRIEGPAPHSLFGDIGVDIQGKPFPVGNYTLVANPNVGPTITVNFSVTDADPLCVNFSASLSGITNPSTCLGFGSATAVPSGGVSPFTYQWDNGETMATANNLPVGPHSVIVGDANGCSKTLTLTLTGPPLPAVTLVPFASVLNTDLAFALTGGSPAGGTYSGAGVTGNTFDPAIGVGTYAITYSYTGPNGCANSATQSITVTSETGNAALLVLDATDDSVLFALTNGLQINKADIGNTPLGIIYNSSLNPGGVTFNLSGPINESRYEGPVPHSLFGDIGVNILGKPFPIGNYTLIANPVSGPTQTINFSVIDGPSGNQSALAARTQLNEMSIAPNPANKEVTMSFEKAILVEEILIFDITGKLIKTIKEPLGLDSKTIDFNVYDLPIGTYFIKTVDSEGMQYQQQMLIHRY